MLGVAWCVVNWLASSLYLQMVCLAWSALFHSYSVFCGIQVCFLSNGRVFDGILEFSVYHAVTLYDIGCKMPCFRFIEGHQLRRCYQYVWNHIKVTSPTQVLNDWLAPCHPTQFVVASCTVSFFRVCVGPEDRSQSSFSVSVFTVYHSTIFHKTGIFQRHCENLKCHVAS